MSKIILHVGSGKTGSTSIQRAFFESKKHNDSIIKYPNLLGHKSSQIFRFAFCPSSATPSNIRGKYINDHKGYANYQEEIKRAFIEEVDGADAVFVSSEFLFLSTEEEVRSISDFLKALGFDEVHIIMYLRDPAKYYLSVAQQALKNQANMPTPEQFRYDLIGAVKNWKSINPASLSIKEFDRSKLFQGDVIKDIEKFVNKNIEQPIRLNLSRQQNETMSVEGTIILQEFYTLLSQCDFEFSDREKYVSRAKKFSRLAYIGTKPVLKEEISMYIHKRFNTEITQLNKSYDIFTELLTSVDSDKIELKAVKSFLDIVTDFDIDNYLCLKSKL